MIQIRNVSKTYYNNDGSVVLGLDNISLQLPKNGLIFINGTSGAGKTTLINSICGIDKVDSGNIIIDGEDITLYNEKKLDDFRKKYIGLVFQKNNLFDNLTVYKNIAIGGEIFGVSEKDLKIVVPKILDFFNLSGMADKRVAELSSGEQQRVAIARAAIKKPKIILADEPTGNLDVATGKIIMDFFQELSKEHLVIIVSHNLEFARLYGERILTIDQGKIVKDINNDFVLRDDEEYYTEINYQDKKIILKNEDKIDDVIANILKEEENVNIQFKKVKKEKKDVKSSKILDLDYNVKTNKTNLKPILYFTFKNFSSRIFKNILVIIMLSLFVFFSVGISLLSFYDYEYNQIQYMNKNKTNYLTLYESVSYNNVFGDGGTKFIYKGKKVGLKIYDIFETPIGVIQYQQMFADTIDTSLTLTVGFLDDDSYLNLDIEGNVPNAINEIIVTDYLCNEGNLKIGDEVRFYGNPFIISGVIKTDFKEMLVKNEEGKLTDLANHKYYYEYQLAFIRKEYLDNYHNQVDVLEINGTDFTSANYLNNYLRRSLKYAKASDFIDEINIIKGETNQRESSVLISESMLNQLNQDFIRNIAVHVSNLNKEEYNGYFDDTFNLYKYYPDGINIIGIYEDSPDLPDVLINDNVFQNMKDDYFNYYFYSYYINYIDGNYSSLVKEYSEANLRWNHTAAFTMEKIDNFRINRIDDLYIIAIIFLILTFSLIFVTMRQSIINSSHAIGILRSLGITRRDSYIIYIFEAFVISISSILFGTIFLFLGIYKINKDVTLIDFKRVMNVFNFNFRVYAIVLAIILSCIALLVFIPIYKMLNKKIADIINKE
ncbi:MAG: ABC transporter ATP-binding protein/permease [Bacilli bacterium]|nr:ABC transporter ATP-binding protein/permease [Bacilli bacterium]